MKWLFGVAAIVVLFVFGFNYVQTTQNKISPAVQVSGNLTSLNNVADLNAGRKLFRANCASCHGQGGIGVKGAGPPFIHRIYEPNHHGDKAFYMAAQNGVRAHHWPYGDMPPQPQVNQHDLAKIVTYIRKVQKQNGIF